MNPTDLFINQLGWAHKNILNNLDFVPDDKLSWKPVPTAKSVLEIIEHMTGTVDMMTTSLKGTDKTALPLPTDRASAKALVTQVVDAHIAEIKTLTPQQLEEKIKLPIGEFPKMVVAGLPVIEMVNHHGQITYIQELLGDDESHLMF